MTPQKRRRKDQRNIKDESTFISKLESFVKPNPIEKWTSIRQLHPIRSVFLCQNDDTSELFVVKAFPKSWYKQHKDRRIRIQHEIVNHMYFAAAAAAALSSESTKSILKPQRWWTGSQGTIFLAVDYVEGFDLFSGLIEPLRFGKDEEDRSIFEWYNEDVMRMWIKDVICALDSMHKNGMVHGDVKPDNLLFSFRDGIVRLADFGASVRFPGNTKNKDKEKKIRYTYDFGTVDYIAPELVNREDFGTGIDTWALGVTAFELCYGFPPFEPLEDPKGAEGHPDTEQKLKHDPYADTKSAIREVAYTFDQEPLLTFSPSEQLKDFISKLLKREPAERMTLRQCLEHSWLKNK